MRADTPSPGDISPGTLPPSQIRVGSTVASFQILSGEVTSEGISARGHLTSNLLREYLQGVIS